MLLTIFNIARNTFREALRQPIYVILLLTSLCIIGTYPIFSLFVFREQVKLVTDGSLATVMVFGWLTAVLCASHAIYREIETGTVLLILSKPVNRITFIFSKILGILGVSTVFVWVTGLATLLAVRIATDQFELDPAVLSMFFGGILLAVIIGGLANYLKRSSFSAVTAQTLLVVFTVVAIIVYFMPEYNFGYKWGEPAGYSANLGKAIFLILLAVWAMATLATALSTQLNLVSNLTCCFILLILGMMSDFFYGRLSALDETQIARALHNVVFVLIPFMLLAWLLTIKHFSTRKQKGVSFVRVHTLFGLATVLLIVRAAVNSLTGVQRMEPALWMVKVAGVIASCKQLVIDTAHAIIPNWQLFWMADALVSDTAIPFQYMVLGVAYIVMFIVVFCALALILFANRDIASQVSQ